MYLERIKISNFRLLRDVTLKFTNGTTVIVGRNNTGKTSLSELFRRLLGGAHPNFRLEDFSDSTHENFYSAFVEYGQDEPLEQVRETLPEMRFLFEIDYGDAEASLPLLSEFVIDLEPTENRVLIEVKNKIADGRIEDLFQSPIPDGRSGFFRRMRTRVPKLYKTTITSIDPTDDKNRRNVAFKSFRELIASGFITAQRGLDDNTTTDRDVLGRILESLIQFADSAYAPETERQALSTLTEAVEDLENDIDSSIREELDSGILPALDQFGYPGIDDADILAETTLDVDRLLRDYTSLRYESASDVRLPEAYNGLGVRNLIFILLRIVEYYRKYRNSEVTPAVQVIFIEEPEAHLHPQMAQIFVRQLGIIADFISDDNWSVQFVLTTHSSHIANQARCGSVRCFRKSSREEGVRWETNVKDVGELFESELNAMTFVERYMTLTRCDLYFADKAILVEGPSERILLPKIIDKIDGELDDGERLNSQYLSIMVVGGAYAQKFFPLLRLLEIPTLIVTDLDSVDHERHACVVSEASASSNGAFDSWFEEELSVAELIEIPSQQRVNGGCRLAYQMKEEGHDACGRTFEDAFALANWDLFFDEFESEGDVTAVEKFASEVWKQGRSKTEFSLHYAIEEAEWNVPRYLKEGLIWLARFGGDDDVGENGAASQPNGVEEVEYD